MLPLLDKVAPSGMPETVSVNDSSGSSMSKEVISLLNAISSPELTAKPFVSKADKPFVIGVMETVTAEELPVACSVVSAFSTVVAVA